MGNKSCFRNERLNCQAFIMSNEWTLPETGVFEFDYVYLIDIPNPDEVTPQEKID